MNNVLLKCLLYQNVSITFVYTASAALQQERVCDSFFHLKAENKIYLFRNIFFSLLKEVRMPMQHCVGFLALIKNKSFNRNLVQTNYKTFWWKIFFNSSTSYLDSINVFYFYFFSISTNSLNEKPFLYKLETEFVWIVSESEYLPKGSHVAIILH